MEFLLLLTVIGMILVTLGLSAMWVSATRRLNAIERELAGYKSDIKTHGRDIRVLKTRAADASDRVIITHEYTTKDAPSYPSKEGL